MFGGDYRLSYEECASLLARRLAEPAPALIQLLSGPRQVGKTTLLLELGRRIGESAIYFAADAPEATLPGAWERLWSRAEEIAAAGRAVVLLDEAHVMTDWAARLKAEWDRARRKKLRINIVATGSSAPRLATGSRESLAGRFERITLTHWSATSLARAFGIAEREAVGVQVRMGTYPGSFALRDDPARWSAYVRDAIVTPAIGRDIVALAPVRRPALLRQVFGVCASSPAQIVSLQKIQGQLQDRGALETIAHYLTLLEDAYLVAALPKHSPVPARRRAAPPKVIALSNAFLAVTDPRGVPEPTTDPARFGAWVENACLAQAWNAGQAVSYWREEPLEVDAVLDGSWGSWVVEVKTGAVSASDLRGITEFAARHRRYRPLLLCDDGQRRVAQRLGVASLGWQDFLLAGPAGARA